nr:uncharacterized protein LOC112000519 isoform X3 [Quercus suber]XP_023888436.1 uncharacterized protein LOC112000519 isoform X3 [Quercus suber]
MAGVQYEDGFVTFPFYDQDFPDMPREPVNLPTKKFTDFGYPDINIGVCAPPTWTLASEDTNFEFVRLVRVQTYLGRGDDHYIQFEAKPSGAADRTLKTFEAAIYEEFSPTPQVFPVTCGLVVPNYRRN